MIDLKLFNIRKYVRVNPLPVGHRQFLLVACGDTSHGHGVYSNIITTKMPSQKALVRRALGTNPLGLQSL
ncbi:hypothetical protein SAMN05421780_101786 [Flexibacter flexilis DSM 6793]|uniref:Uncharacterized protein n=1 Tax=Flexibacter flexilis DSM 6793 TaxID=927664 RepID=A0A1I1EFK3_9BACT|nr:hypothetical protein [Flexibacter flexilis]SFB85881.1 hypothetical protein SAMN05421780_101786 [Flexibacter flexilis DSM 6793]